MNNKHGETTLFIGFPKSLTISQVEQLVFEIFDYLDNNDEVDVFILQQDKDYSHLDFRTSAPSHDDEASFYYKALNLIDVDDVGTAKINIVSHRLVDVCELLKQSNYQYNDIQNYWY